MKNLKHFLPILAILSISSIITACLSNDGDESHVYGVSTWYSKDSVVGGSHYLFNVEAHATNGTLTEMNISSYDPIQGLKDLAKVPLSGTKYTYEYDYLVPILADSVTEVQLRVQIKNSEGETWNATKYLKVFTSDFRLKEITGLLIYEKPSINRPNALNFMGGGAQPIVTTVEEKDSIKNFIAYYDEQTGDAMSKAFYTKSQEKNYNVYMAKMSNFDYAGATYKSVLNACQNAADLGRGVSNLKENDIVIVGLIDGNSLRTPLAAVRIVRILDEAGKENDCYELNVKTMQRQQ